MKLWRLIQLVVYAGICVCLIGLPNGPSKSGESSASLGSNGSSESSGPATPKLDTIGSSEAGRPRLLLPLYAGFATLQVLDIHSTLRGLESGGREANPLMKGVVGSPAAFLAVKAGAAAGLIFAVEKLRKKHPGAAVLLMVGVNSAFATVVAHNYAIVK